MRKLKENEIERITTGLKDIFEESINYDVDSLAFVKSFLNSSYFKNMTEDPTSRYVLFSPGYTLNSYLNKHKIKNGQKLQKHELSWLADTVMDLMCEENMGISAVASNVDNIMKYKEGIHFYSPKYIKNKCKN